LAPEELAKETRKRSIVENISARHVDRLLKEADLRPHKSRCWLTTRDKLEAPEQFTAQVQEICELYTAARALEE
jgi:hypothetical protein